MRRDGLSRRQFLRMTALSGGALALAACAAPAAPAAETASQPAAQQAAPPVEEPKVITYWYAWGNLDPAMATIVETDEWKAHSGGATLEYKGSVNNEAILTAVAGGTPPDGGSNFDYPNLFTRGAVIPVQDMVASSEILKKENMLEWVWDYAWFGGQMIGIPGIESYVQWGLNYNAKAATDAGLDADTPPSTWSETLEWHKAMTKKDAAGNLLQVGLDPYDAMGGDVDYGPASYGVKWFDEETREFHLDDERVAHLLDTTAEFYRIADPDQFAGMRQVQGNGAWGGSYNAGVQTMIIEGYWHPGETQIQMPEIAQHNRSSWGPVSDEMAGRHIQGVNAHFVQIFKDAKNKDGAFKVGEFFNTPKALDIIFAEVGWIQGINSWLATVDADAYPGLRWYIDAIPEVTDWYLLRRCPIHWFIYNQQGEIREQIARNLITAEEGAAELQRRALAEWEAQGLS
ncbi:MAG: extracellular solute-binding protein [Caldilineaceae bacterium]|nr:extracellular solute-binding protein [Caldilineaceae bacterium]